MAIQTQRIGALRERLTIQQNSPLARAVSSLVRSGTTATVTTALAHGYLTNDYVTIAGALPVGYNGTAKITVTGASSFTYTVDNSLTTPATGTIAAAYASDAQGDQRRSDWRTLARISAELVPLRAIERLQIGAVQANLTCRFRVRARPDLAETQRVTWTPSWPPGEAEQTFEIIGIVPDGDGRTYRFLECARAVAP